MAGWRGQTHRAAKADAETRASAPDPLVAVSDELRAWFEADPAQSGSALLVRRQSRYPDLYPDALLRTVQRRLKLWRSESASRLVFGLPDQRLGAAASGTYA